MTFLLTNVSKYRRPSEWRNAASFRTFIYAEFCNTWALGEGRTQVWFLFMFLFTCGVWRLLPISSRGIPSSPH